MARQALGRGRGSTLPGRAEAKAAAAGGGGGRKPVKIKPNEKCPCGGGKKYKKCHGANWYLNGGGEGGKAWDAVSADRGREDPDQGWR